MREIANDILRFLRFIIAMIGMITIALGHAFDAWDAATRTETLVEVIALIIILDHIIDKEA